MEDLQQATEKICELKGSLLVVDAFIASLIRVLPTEAIAPLHQEFEKQAEALQATLLHASISEHTIAVVAHDIPRLSKILIDRMQPNN
jgi:hypothetical protein